MPSAKGLNLKWRQEVSKAGISVRTTADGKTTVISGAELLRQLEGTRVLNGATMLSEQFENLVPPGVSVMYNPGTSF